MTVVSKRRWIEATCGHRWPSQAPEHLYVRFGEHGLTGLRVRGQGTPVCCLVCGNGALVASVRWRWPDELDDLGWSRWPAPPEVMCAQARLNEEV